MVWTAPREAAWREAGERPAVAVWTAGQSARFLTAIRGEPLYPCYQLMAVSGLRRGEAAGLRWCDIDFAGTTLTVSRQLQETSRRLVLLPPKSIAGNRVLALDPWTLQEAYEDLLMQLLASLATVETDESALRFSAQAADSVRAAAKEIPI